MIDKLKKLGLGVLTLFIMSLNCVVIFIPILLLGALKLFPNSNWRVLCTKMVETVSEWWISFNHFFINRLHKIDWQIDNPIPLDSKSWNLVIANHQSWVDVFVLQKVFNYKIPMLKFFVKDSLKWIPLLGFAWWVLGCPFMKRYSKQYLLKNPQKKGEDLRATEKACEFFKKSPASIMSFLEGTRFSTEKQKKQKSPYQNLLKPKAGGISQIINVMNNQITSILDVTIVYPDNKKTFWDYLSGKMKSVKVTIRQLPIPSQFLNARLTSDEKLQQAFRDWLNARWQEKDLILTEALV